MVSATFSFASASCGHRLPADRRPPRGDPHPRRALPGHTEGGGRLVTYAYAGGDIPTRQDGTEAAFTSRFPDIDLTLVVDYSRYHDVRVDNQFTTNTLVPALSSADLPSARWPKGRRCVNS